ncbi:hypothetical protein LOC68_04735 [Blastopirellula sp. JC732]|uniref:Uncharacterized protein n=1 Tax=Blastopirellula sediminis TaxID=2894196 RepID=A0A9X1MK51_9BACT|nr:hypothetical protein [Blastopirellula sediminis]MCC9609534.1 hypothetical protein [Blastopirellula sediminis]MCC9627690.1 hypothetical protein [Blastopirellula sediminis]
MIFGLKTLFVLVCGVSICFAVAVNTHPIFALPMGVILCWSMISSYNPELGAEFEQEAFYGIVISILTAVVVYVSL